jgi:hypothetical protein
MFSQSIPTQHWNTPLTEIVWEELEPQSSGLLVSCFFCEGGGPSTYDGI